MRVEGARWLACLPYVFFHICVFSFLFSVSLFLHTVFNFLSVVISLPRVAPAVVAGLAPPGRFVISLLNRASRRIHHLALLGTSRSSFRADPFLAELPRDLIFSGVTYNGGRRGAPRPVSGKST